MKKRDILVLSVAGIIAAAAGVYMALKKRNQQSEETPPEEAPQLDINNPGQQSDFLTAPTEEGELG